MSDHQEEQEMEAEALAAIFDDHFSIVKGDSMPFCWKVTLWPEATNEEGENHVGIELQVTLPMTYPEEESALPDCEISILKGLTQEHASTLLALSKEEAEANAGVPSIFAICERLREWLVEHNQKGHDDVSMHAQMLRRKKEQEKQNQQSKPQFEAQKAHDEMTEAERDDLEMRRKRAEGTPVTKESFEEWKAKFEQEMIQLKQQQEAEAEAAQGGGKKKSSAASAAAAKAEIEKKGRLTGFQHFSGKAINLEALEAAAENAEADPEEEEEEAEEDGGAADGGGIQEELFDVDDEDLDDLDFDDDDEDEDEEEDVDI